MEFNGWEDGEDLGGDEGGNHDQNILDEKDVFSTKKCENIS